MKRTSKRERRAIRSGKCFLYFFYSFSLLFCWRAFLECFVLYFERRANRFEHSLSHLVLNKIRLESIFCFVLKPLSFTGRERRPEESRWGNTKFLSKFVTRIGEPKKFYTFFTPYLFPLKYSLASF